jgi:hypothetical protein
MRRMKWELCRKWRVDKCLEGNNRGLFDDICSERQKIY